MNEYLKPEVEYINFLTEEVAMSPDTDPDTGYGNETPPEW